MKRILLSKAKRIGILFLVVASLVVPFVPTQASSVLSNTERSNLNDFLGAVLRWSDLENEIQYRKNPKKFSDNVLLGTVWELDHVYGVVKAKYKIVPSYGGQQDFITVKEMNQITTQLFGRRIKNGKSHSMYQSSSPYGAGYAIPQVDGEEATVAQINGVKKTKNGIIVTFSSAKEITGTFYGNYKAVLKTNKKSPVKYTLLSITKQKTANVKLKQATASSSLNSYGSIQYSPKNLMDGKLNTAWCEGVNGVGIGQWTKLTWSKKESISAIAIYPGYQKSEELRQKNGAPTKMKFDFSDGTSLTVDLDDYRNYTAYQRQQYFYIENKGTLILLNKKITASSVKVTILGAEAGSKYEDTCISELKFY